MKKLVRESIVEGVADVAAEKMFNVQKPHADFENQYAKQLAKDKEEIIAVIKGTGYHKSTYIIKNPKNLKNIGPDARGVIDSEGNLYIENISMTIHSGILDELFSRHIIEPSQYPWWLVSPNKTGFVTVQKDSDKNEIYIGESNDIILSRPHREDKYSKREILDHEAALLHFTEFFEKAKKKNPGFNFISQKIL